MFAPPSFPITRNLNERWNSTTQPIYHRIQTNFRRIFGNKLKYVLFTFFLSLFCLYAMLIQDNEKRIWTIIQPPPPKNESTIDSFDPSTPIITHNNSSFPLIQNNGTETNSTIYIHDKRHPASSLSLWVSIAISILSWIFLIQVLRYIRFYSYSQANYQRQREQLQFLHALSRSNIPGLSTRLRIAMLQRDFTGDDYELLQQLDDVRFNEGPAIRQGAAESSIQQLPLRKLTQQDIQSQDTETPIGNCPICLGPYEVGDEVRTILCMHKFHRECIDPWLRNKNICPVCKFPGTDPGESHSI